MLHLNLTPKDFNKIKFKKHHEQLAIIRHDFTNYDTIISDINWKDITIQFNNLISNRLPTLRNAAKQWTNYKKIIKLKRGK